MKTLTPPKPNTKFKELIDSKGFGAPQLAEESGVSYGLIINILNGYTSCRVNKIAKIAKALDVDFDDLRKIIRSGGIS